MNFASQWLALGLCIVVGVLAGIMIAPLFPLSPREGVFIIVLLGGIVALVWINTNRKVTTESDSPRLLESGAASSVPQSASIKPRVAEPVQRTAWSSPAMPAQVLSAEEARAWLDELLTKQQSGSGE